MDSSGAVVVGRGSSGSKKGSKGRLRRLMKACWTPPSSTEAMEGEAEEEEEEEEEPTSFASIPDDVLLEVLLRLPRPALASAMAVCPRWRKLAKSPEFYGLRELESLMFVFGGAGGGVSVVYSKSSGEGWKSGSLFSTKALLGNEWLFDYHGVDHAFAHAQPAVVKQLIYILGVIPLPSSSSSKSGGGGLHNHTLVYDTWTGSLVRKAAMRVPRKKFASCVIAGKVYVAGGSRWRDPGKEAMADAEVYDPESDTWRSIPNMPRKRYGCLGAAIGGLFYVIGGLKSSLVSAGICLQPFAYVGSIDTFDPMTNTWRRTKALPMVGCVIACAASGSCIYMLSSLAVELSFWKYDTRNDSWAKMKPPPIPTPLRLDNYLKFSCVAVGTCVYVVQVGGSIDDLLRRSGRNARGYKEGLVLVYDTMLQEWSRGPDLPYIRNGVGCAVVQC